MAFLWILDLADGRHSLLDIAERANLPFAVVAEAARLLGHVGFLSKRQVMRGTRREPPPPNDAEFFLIDNASADHSVEVTLAVHRRQMPPIPMHCFEDANPFGTAVAALQTERLTGTRASSGPCH
jgi:hypothetical protein